MVTQQKLLGSFYTWKPRQAYRYIFLGTGKVYSRKSIFYFQFRNLIESETLQFSIDCNYPLYWNEHQEWVMNLTGCKASAYLIFAHKWFFQGSVTTNYKPSCLYIITHNNNEISAMVNDWSSRTPPDILGFVPYTWKINFILKEFEIVTVTNEYNWIDCSSQHPENVLLAACGEIFELSFDLPFHEFLPETVLFKFWIQIEGGDLNFYIPEVSSAFIAVDSIHKNAKIRNRDGSITWNLSAPKEQEIPPDGKQTRHSKLKKWRNICKPRYIQLYQEFNTLAL